MAFHKAIVQLSGNAVLASAHGDELANESLMNREPNKRIRLGMLTPSSNSVLEPMTTAIIAGQRHVSAHFSRFRVTQVGLSERELDQFADAEILRAAGLLADAKVDGLEKSEACRFCHSSARSMGSRVSGRGAQSG